MSFFDELAKHADSPYGVVALVCVLVILGILKYAPRAHRIQLAISILIVGIGAVLVVNHQSKATTQVFYQSNNGSGGVFNVNSGAGVQVNNEGK